ITFFTGAPQNRRKYPRRAGPFPAWVAVGSTWSTIICLDISGSGMGIVSPGTLGEEANIRINLEKRNILIRAKRVWQQPGTAKGKPAWRYGLTFTGISADDWDAVVRFCNNGAVNVENKAQQELELVRLQADDVARLIPKKLQDALLAMLVQRGRLAPLNERTPLVQYSYGGVIKRGGNALHRLSIHSRVRDDLTGEVKSYDTRFFFDDAGTNVTQED
ncbi:MAG TPA: PilZ domain-containing protein, partial [Candidatus Baltobacteraceae bacterium]|nr:PilZ domain-containing protein [Candidatus Baltobacteraceae bacterium]